MYLGAKPELFKRAAEMRKNPTQAEKVLWKQLRKFRSNGFTFRQQHPIDLFIADFYCHRLRLIIEVDGEIHFSDQAREYDDGRTAELEKFGIKIIRFSNEEVLSDQQLVLEKVTKIIEELASPSLPGEGE